MPQPERSEAYKQFNIKHMIEVVELRIFNETGKIVKINYPQTPEDHEKLEVMYNRALAKYGENNKSES